MTIRKEAQRILIENGFVEVDTVSTIRTFSHKNLEELVFVTPQSVRLGLTASHSRPFVEKFQQFKREFFPQFESWAKEVNK